MTSRRKGESKGPSESVIQASILRWLNGSGLLYWRQNSGFGFVGGRHPGARRRVTMGPAGCPDIIVVVPPNGRFVGLEVKSATGRIRPAQREFGERLERAGASYYIVRSLKEAKECLFKETATLLSGTARPSTEDYVSS